MKNERFERYIYMGVTAILVLIAAVFVVFLFLERNAVPFWEKYGLSWHR